MGASNSNTINIEQSFSNKAVQISQTTCHADCRAIRQDDKFIISGSTINGDVNLGQICNASANCIMSNQVDATVNNVLQSLIMQTATSNQDMFATTFNSNSNAANIKQQVVNNLTQVLNASCDATADVVDSGSLYYVANSTINGSFIQTQVASAQAQCSMNNAAKIAIFNQSTAQADQKAKDENVLTAIVGILVVGSIIIAIVYVFFTGDNKDNKTATPNKTAATTTTTGKGVSSISITPPTINVSAPKINFAPSTVAMPPPTTVTSQQSSGGSYYPTYASYGPYSPSYGPGYPGPYGYAPYPTFNPYANYNNTALSSLPLSTTTTQTTS